MPKKYLQIVLPCTDGWTKYRIQKNVPQKLKIVIKLKDVYKYNLNLLDPFWPTATVYKINSFMTFRLHHNWSFSVLIYKLKKISLYIKTKVFTYK